MGWKIKSGDEVIVLSGRDKGHSGKIIRVFRDTDRVLVEKVALRLKHVKSSVQNPEGGRIMQETSLHRSNVALLDPETKKPTRVGLRFDAHGKKERYAKRSGHTIGRK